MTQVDITLINKLVKEFTTQHDLAEKVRTVAPENKQEYTVELSKVYGLLYSIKLEADLLMADYTKLLKMSTAQVPTQLETENFINDIFTSFKAPKN